MRPPPSKASLGAVLFVVSATAGACGTGGVPPGGQSKLADRTFAGQNRCNPRNADRPFIVQWDATDQSSFQSYAQSNIVFVRYEGCDLKVLDGCRDDSVKGSVGSYNPIEWTSGGVETVDIHDESELYAKLPLGAAALGGRVQSGEKFHMEYYVSGTRSATRDKVFRASLPKNPQCSGATHFVYAYNLGAFALASAASLKGEVNGSYFGFGAGATHGTESSAEKKGGDLGSCKGESAKEVESCKVPVRLTLREISDGDDPAAAAATAPDTDASLNLAGRLQATTDAEKQAAARLDAASVKKQSKDGASCLSELDQHDKLDPRPGGLSTSPASGKVAGLRAECLMLAGQCAAGKALFGKAVAATKGGEVGPEQIDRITEAEAALYCAGSKLGDRDLYLRALSDLRMGGLGVQKRSLAECQSAFDVAMRLRAGVKRKDDSDMAVPEKPLVALEGTAPQCMARAGDCTAAFKAHDKINAAKGPDDGFKAKDDKAVRSLFETLNPSCKGK